MTILYINGIFHCVSRWIVDNKLDQLKFARQKLAYCYFSAAATLFSPELTDARISWAKNGVLTTVVDDFFDVGGSEEELINLIELVEKYVLHFHLFHVFDDSPQVCEFYRLTLSFRHNSNGV